MYIWLKGICSKTCTYLSGWKGYEIYDIKITHSHAKVSVIYYEFGKIPTDTHIGTCLIIFTFGNTAKFFHRALKNIFFSLFNINY